MIDENILIAVGLTNKMRFVVSMVVTWNEFSCLSLDFLQDKGEFGPVRSGPFRGIVDPYGIKYAYGTEQ